MKIRSDEARAIAQAPECSLPRLIKSICQSSDRAGKIRTTILGQCLICNIDANGTLCAGERNEMTQRPCFARECDLGRSAFICQCHAKFINEFGIRMGSCMPGMNTPDRTF